MVLALIRLLFEYQFDLGQYCLSRSRVLIHVFIMLVFFRAFHGTEGGAAQKPDSNRYMELIIIKLCSAYPSPVKEGGKRMDRWSQIARWYKNIRELALNSPWVMDQTGITLYAITTHIQRISKDKCWNKIYDWLEPCITARTSLYSTKVNK